MKRIGLISILLGLGVINAFPQDSIVTIPDTAFLHALINRGVDSNEDSLINYMEAEAVTYLDVHWRFIQHSNITDMTGIEAFINLDTLICSRNQLTRLDVSRCTNLTYLNCDDNQLTNLDVSGCTGLNYLECWNNQLTRLDVSGCTGLKYLECWNNQLTGLDVTNNTALTELECEFNQIANLDVTACSSLEVLHCFANQFTSLDVSGCTNLTYLNCDDNQLTNLDVSNNSGLKHLDCSNNLLTSLNVSGCIAMTRLYCGNNPLTSLNISTNINLSDEWHWFDMGGGYFVNGLNLTYMPTLNEVCVWENPFPPNNLSVDTMGSPNVCFDTICNGVCDGTVVDAYTPSGFNIYPNPTYTLLNIETGTIEVYSIDVTSLNGQLIFGKQMEGTTHQIDLSSFQKGVYFITIRSKDFVTTRKIIKL